MSFKRAEDFEGESLTQTYAAAATRKIGYWLRLKVYQRKYGLWSAHPEERATLSTGKGVHPGNANWNYRLQ